MTSLMICTPHQVLFGPSDSNKAGWDGRDM